KSAQDAANKQHLHLTYTNSLLLEGLLINFVILLALGVLLGVIGGAVGGNFGRRRAQLPPVEEYHEAMLEPPNAPEAEEPSTASEPEELLSTSETVAPSSETHSGGPSSSAQQAE